MAPSPCQSLPWPVRVAPDGDSCLLLGTSLLKGVESELWPAGMRVTDSTNQALTAVGMKESDRKRTEAEGRRDARSSEAWGERWSARVPWGVGAACGFLQAVQLPGGLSG